MNPCDCIGCDIPHVSDDRTCGAMPTTLHPEETRNAGEPIYLCPACWYEATTLPADQKRD